MPSQRDVFMALHGALATVTYWQELQRRVREGHKDDISPYAQELRFVPRRVTKVTQVHAKAS